MVRERGIADDVRVGRARSLRATLAGHGEEFGFHPMWDTMPS